MTLLNTAAHSGWPAKLLHWLVAALVLGLLVIGFTMVWLVSDLGRKFELYQLHKSFGVVVFMLVLLRLGWRWLNPQVPALPANLRPWERTAALLSHRSFYVLLLLMPLTGWLTASASPLGVPTVVFGLFQLPNPVGANPTIESVMSVVHATLAVTLVLLLVLHVGAALKHHLVLRDDVLVRMLPGHRGGRA
jgi:cytochrome b561